MKKILARSLLVILALVLVLVLIFWGRFSGSFTIYRIISHLSQDINRGQPELNLRLVGSWSQEGKFDSLHAKVQYHKDNHFLAQIRLKQQQYIIHSNPAQTNVRTSKPDLLITGTGSDQGNFDLLLLVKEILQHHPKLEPFLSLSWFNRVAIGVLAFFRCDFHQDKWQNQRYQVIELPQKAFPTHVSLWFNKKTGKDFRLVLADSAATANFQIFLEKLPYTGFQIDTTAVKRLVVARQELNTAIYRGAIRAAGIKLEGMMPPKFASQERAWGRGRLVNVAGNPVFIASGSHRELGKAHGALLTREVRKMVDATLYTICWLYTMERGRWFIDDMRAAYGRLEPFIPVKYQEEMAGLAETTGISLEEIRLTNVFPELFHCSGFALFNQATADGKLYHGRILDYITELGLQFHAVVYIVKPEGSHAFANIGYAGFIGSVSGMNEHQVALGEMGGRGEGDWDGMPMGFLMREGLERAQTLDEAVAIFRDTPRTCEYYYVISDGKIPDARGLATSPSRFDVVEPNQLHPLLPHPMADAVLLSAGDRYENLVKRVRQDYGNIDLEKAIRLMDRPVAMKSNLHNVLFVPQSLEFWVANAGAGTPACNEPYTRYSLKELLLLAGE